MAPMYVPMNRVIVGDAVSAYIAQHPPEGGKNPTDAQVKAAVQAYMMDNPLRQPQDGQSVTPEMVSASVAQWLDAHPIPVPQDGKDASVSMVAQAVSDYFVANPIRVPRDGDPGLNATTTMVNEAVAGYLASNPPAAGRPGADATPEMVAQVVSAYFAANPVYVPKDGKDATPAMVSTAVAAYFAANPVPVTKDGINGKSAFEVAQAAGFYGTQAEWLASLKAPAIMSLLGTVTLTQNAALVAIAIGFREVVIPLVGARKGDKLIPFCSSYKLNNGAAVAGRPTGWSLVDAVCNTDDQVIITTNGPLLALGARVDMTCPIVKVLL